MLLKKVLHLSLIDVAVEKLLEKLDCPPADLGCHALLSASAGSAGGQRERSNSCFPCRVTSSVTLGRSERDRSPHHKMTPDI